MIRVLHCLGGLGTGGTEALIMNWYRHIDRTKIQFDFLVRSTDDNYVDEIKTLGGRIFFTSSFPKHFLRNAIETRHIIQQSEWDVIHVHGNAALYMTVLFFANQNNVKTKIFHSHSTNTPNIIFRIVHYINRLIIPHVTDVQLACSREAGKWMYGNKKYIVLKNAIELEKYFYHINDRITIRNEFSLEGKYVVGHIGRFTKPKNHKFLLDVFVELKKINTNAILLLVGDGDGESEIRNYSKVIGIEDSIVFSGRRNDIGKLLSAMDVFVFPSLWEGLGIVLIEAQANGLPCFASKDIIREEVKITELLHGISLDKRPKEWAMEIVEADSGLSNRNANQVNVQKSGYDIHTVVAELERIYLDGSNKKQ